ncbi:MAG: 50S ribosomal protein L23 [Pseudomonadota bacterium]
MSEYNLIRRPYITEKAMTLKDEENKFVFEVKRDANKIQVKKAIEKLFNVKVTNISSMIQRGKTKRIGKDFGKRPNWKKVYVTLKKGDSIEFYEGV